MVRSIPLGILPHVSERSEEGMSAYDSSAFTSLTKLDLESEKHGERSASPRLVGNAGLFVRGDVQEKLDPALIGSHPHRGPLV